MSSGLSAGLAAFVVAVQHLDPRHRSLMAEILSKRTHLEVNHAEEGDPLRHGWVYGAPPNHHVPVKRNGTLSLSQPELVHFVRPLADLLFESPAASYEERAIAMVLTGSDSDGSMAVKAVKPKRGM